MKPGRRSRPIAAALVVFVIYASAKLALAQNPVGAGTPSDPSACAQLMKLREDIAAQELDIKFRVRFGLHAQEMCLVWKDYVREEEHMVKYVEENTSVCRLSDDLIQLIRIHYNHSLVVLDKVCSVRPPPPLPRKNPCIWTVTRPGTECKISS
jgi:hypothetical protein